MELVKRITLSIIVLISSISCSVAKKQDTKINNEIVTIEFYSKGAGIDFKAKKLLEEFIIKFNEENNTNITYTSIKHGKEGETNLTFDISQLSDSQKSEFKASITEQLKTAKNIRISKK